MKHITVVILIALLVCPAFADDAGRDKACDLHAKIASKRARIIQKAVKLRKKMNGKDGRWRDLLDNANNMIAEEEEALKICAGPNN